MQRWRYGLRWNARQSQRWAPIATTSGFYTYEQQCLRLEDDVTGIRRRHDHGSQNTEGRGRCGRQVLVRGIIDVFQSSYSIVASDLVLDTTIRLSVLAETVVLSGLVVLAAGAAGRTTSRAASLSSLVTSLMGVNLALGELCAMLARCARAGA